MPGAQQGRDVLIGGAFRQVVAGNFGREHVDNRKIESSRLDGFGTKRSRAGGSHDGG